MPIATEGRVVPAVLELRDLDVSGSKKFLEGRAVPYGVTQQLGWYSELMEQGMFAKSIREAANGLPLLLFHDSSSLDAHIGKAHKWTEQDDGLHGVWRLADSDVAQRAARMAEEGLLGYMSVGFQPLRSTSQYDDADNLTIIRHEGRLLEVSLVSTPAYQGATVTKIRTAEPMTHPEIAGRRAVEGWREYLASVGVGTG